MYYGDNMTKYRVYGKVEGTKYLGTFEANSKEEAENMAGDSEEAYVCLCHACSSECEDAEITTFTAEEV